MNKLLAIIGSVIVMSISITAGSKKETPERRFALPPEKAATVSLNADDDFHIPGYGKSYIGFKEAIGFKESQGRYWVINSLGYMGKYQFGVSTLATLRIWNTEYFLNNSRLQEKTFRANCNYNKWLLKEEIARYCGTTIKGISITESGIIAAAHLSGAGNVKRFLHHKGNQTIKDSYGSRIEHYLKKFAGYDVSFLEATQKPRIN